MLIMHSIYCLIIGLFICFSCAANVPAEDAPNKPRLMLAEDTANEIFEYLQVEDYAAFKSVSIKFRKVHDDSVYRMALKAFPGLTRAVLRQWNEEDPVADHLKYQLLALVMVKPYIGAIDFELDLITESNLKANSMQLIKSFASSNMDICARLISLFLRLEFVKWLDIVSILYYKKKFLRIWSLGLMTIAREMSIHRMDSFIFFTGPKWKGLLIAIEKRHKALVHFIIITMPINDSFSLEEEIYSCNVIKELIDAKYWDLLYDYYEKNLRIIDHSYYSKFIAEKGHVEGLKILRNLSITHQYVVKVACIAASHGKLEFLKEFDAVGLLRSDCYPAIHAAASKCQVKCLEFLVNRLGSEVLCLEDENELLPIHLAARSKSSDALRFILRHYPHYRVLSSKPYQSELTSPLLEAVKNGSIENARILLETFPELIYVSDSEKENAIHWATDLSEDSMLEMLLKFATPELITERNCRGDTPLHLGRNCEKLAILMRTGLFTGLERNNAGKTPIGEFLEHHFENRGDSDYTRLREIFKMQSDSELFEAAKVKGVNFFNFFY